MRKAIIVAVFIVGIFLLLHLLSQKAPNLPVLPRATNQNYNTNLKVGDIELMVEVVDTVESRAQGLSGRKSLCETCGMLFDFKVVDIIPSFWMKDMLIPIDIIWINDGAIVGIEKNVQPEPGKSDNELANYSPQGVIDYVLEVNADFSEKQSVEIGQSIVFP